ncbi:hypothetical protein H9Y04_42660 [Streptomyces sp. TRM66268-LWL]|uniref:Uncharacterized protein n=1 Tax=Streptomyces polyasparticus TaxID=2767826 RepID=A0ABR7SUT1_9ACTN|nr:hypothetical protein [Streptomyces polyasparticus]MBC9719235.1 hypothetical protein [Streptomyces polyasparticus]
MSVIDKSSSRDAALQQAFGTEVSELLRTMPAPNQVAPARAGLSPKIAATAPTTPAASRAAAMRTRHP